MPNCVRESFSLAWFEDHNDALDEYKYGICVMRIYPEYLRIGEGWCDLMDLQDLAVSRNRGNERIGNDEDEDEYAIASDYFPPWLASAFDTCYDS